MPNIAVHLLLAGRALAAWRARPAAAPFPPGDARAVEAFVHGAVSPDAGYYPRSDRLFSELAHLWRTGALCRALLDEARTPLQRAHAWGWATHVLADLAVHPRINAAHGERLHGAQGRPVTSTQDEGMHMRLEYGLDAAVFALHPEVARLRPGPAPAGAELAHVSRAYARTYGWEPSPAFLARAHRSGRLAASMSHLLNRVMTATPTRRPLHAALRAGAAALAPPRRWLPAGWNASHSAAAVFSPLPPPPWLVDEVRALADRFALWLDELRQDALRALPDHDLVTGDLVSPADPSPRTAAALRLLASRAALAPAALPAPTAAPAAE